jgi:hypothetical protein
VYATSPLEVQVKVTATVPPTVAAVNVAPLVGEEIPVTRLQGDGGSNVVEKKLPEVCPVALTV